MSERKHESKGKETKAAIQVKREEEQQPDKKPSEALSRLSANVAQPGDIQALQKSVGNRAVQRLVQRSEDVVQRRFTDDPEYGEWRTRANVGFNRVSSSLWETASQMSNTQSEYSSAADTYNEGRATQGGGEETPAGGTTSEESETSTGEGG